MYTLWFQNFSYALIYDEGKIKKYFTIFPFIMFICEL